jgi:hypothetical protein
MLDPAISEIALSREIENGAGDHDKSRLDYLTGRGANSELTRQRNFSVKRPWPPLVKVRLHVAESILCSEMPVTRFDKLPNLPGLA